MMCATAMILANFKPLVFSSTHRDHYSMIDCDQSLFFFRFSESNERAREPSVTRVAICVSRVLLDGLQKKERLLVV